MVGARVEESAFRRQWDGLPLDEAARLRGEGGSIDAITGASITSRAVVDGTNRIVELVLANRETVLAAIDGAGDGNREAPER